VRKRTIWLAIAFVAAVVGAVIYSSLGMARYKVEVCMEFQGRNACRIAAAATEQQALRTATENACTLIAFGREDSAECEWSRPARVRWLAGR